MTAPATPNFLNVSKAAELIGCSEGLVRQWLIDKKISGLKINERAWAIPRKEAEKMKRTIGTTGRPRRGQNHTA